MFYEEEYGVWHYVFVSSYLYVKLNDSANNRKLPIEFGNLFQYGTVLNLKDGEFIFIKKGGPMISDWDNLFNEPSISFTGDSVNDYLDAFRIEFAHEIRLMSEIKRVEMVDVRFGVVDFTDPFNR